MRNKSDDQADALISSFVQEDKLALLYKTLALEDELIGTSNAHTELQRFILEPRQLPAWFDDSRIKKGQAFFRKYALDIMTLLGVMSLPYCYAATPGNKAIHLTQKMRKNPGKRLLETAHFIIRVFEEDTFSNGFGHIQINKTRLIHALVRHYILTKCEWNPSWGIPVNQEDMAGTNLAFSYIILVGLEDSGYPITLQEKEDFLYTWQYIGYQLHIHNELLPSNFEEARLLESAIKKRHFKPSHEGEVLTAELLQHYKESFPAVPAYFVDGQIRYYLGREIYSLIGLAPQPFKDGIVRMMNKAKEKLNRVYRYKNSYQRMLKNHTILKAKYS